MRSYAGVVPPYPVYRSRPSLGPRFGSLAFHPEEETRLDVSRRDGLRRTFGTHGPPAC